MMACPTCATPFETHEKYNNGNPIIVELPECDCYEKQLDEYVDRMLASKKLREENT